MILKGKKSVVANESPLSYQKSMSWRWPHRHTHGTWKQDKNQKVQLSSCKLDGILLSWEQPLSSFIRKEKRLKEKGKKIGKKKIFLLKREPSLHENSFIVIFFFFFRTQCRDREKFTPTSRVSGADLVWLRTGQLYEMLYSLLQFWSKTLMQCFLYINMLLSTFTQVTGVSGSIAILEFFERLYVPWMDR